MKGNLTEQQQNVLRILFADKQPDADNRIEFDASNFMNEDVDNNDHRYKLITENVAK